MSIVVGFNVEYSTDTGPIVSESNFLRNPLLRSLLLRSPIFVVPIVARYIIAGYILRFILLLNPIL